MTIHLPSFSCNPICAPTNHVLHRVHASCLWCSTRKGLTNPKYQYMPQFGNVLPPHFDCLTAILNGGTGYIIYYDEDAWFGKYKRICLFKLFGIAERCRYTQVAKRLYTICEFLCT